MKTFYSDYIGHCLRYYVRHRNAQTFRSRVDRNNWLACQRIVSALSQQDQILILAVFGEADTKIAEVVGRTAKKMHMSAGKIWKIIYDTEKKIARIRGLL